MRTGGGPARERGSGPQTGSVSVPLDWTSARPGDAPLVVSSYTLGTTVDFGDRVRAAASAGFAGIGLRAENCWDALAAGWSADQMADFAAAEGVPVREVEYLTGWGSAADRTEEQRRKESTFLAMARGFGVRHMNAGLLEHLSVARVVDAFGALCDRAGDDLVVALEFMPYSGVPDLATAWQVVESAGRANGALLVDIWHWARAGLTPADLDGVPADRIVSVQLCDVRAEPMSPLRAESLGHRLLPGTGYGDAINVLRALRSHGVRPDVIGVEVISDELIAGGVPQAAQAAADAARTVLAAAGWTTATA